VEAIAVESPPYFHPEQAAAGVDAGVHVYLAKPVAVDVPGCLSLKKSGEKASVKRLCFLVDFQTRANEYFIEALRRVHEGDLGTFAFGESSYHDISPWQQWYELLGREPENPEARLKAWGLDRALSGDAITEQNIHTLDVANWIMNTPPVYAVGTGGRKVRPDVGNCWDHFTCLFQYPNNVAITFSSRQFNGWGSPGGIKNRMFGSKGVLETEYVGTAINRGLTTRPGQQGLLTLRSFEVHRIKHVKNKEIEQIIRDVASGSESLVKLVTEKEIIEGRTRDGFVIGRHAENLLT